MYKIAVLGDYDSIYGFATLGLDTYPAYDPTEAVRTLRRLADGNYAVIYITEALAAEIDEELNRYRSQRLPAIILIPGREGSLGIGKSNIQSAIERAVGADIL